MISKKPKTTPTFFQFYLIGILFCLQGSTLAADLRVFEPGKQPNDIRLKEPKNLNGYFPFLVPDTVDEWEARAAQLRRRIKVATGLWPLPKKTPLNPVIHGKMRREGFTVEKVYFESIPNHFVTGLLFRPDDGQTNIKRPAVLCPHGHGGRLQDAGAKNIAEAIASGAEKFENSGRFPKLARCAHLARMGCVVFIFDMLGYADSVQIDNQLAHRFAKQRPELEDAKNWGLFSAQAEMRLQSIMGIQTWNSIRCLDFLQQLPDVDGNRIGVTGGSGGGTQTILLCAIDPRPIAAFPNGMVSTAMQGGCPCENCTLLRVDTGNVELAALFAPKPQAMTAANDWTKDMMTKGYPELQKLYTMLGAGDNVYCREMLHFPHNYNYVSRRTMYTWFNKHMNLNQENSLEETDWELFPLSDLSVWNHEHPKPEGGVKYERELTRYLADESDQQLAKLGPVDDKSRTAFRNIIGGAWKSIVGRGIPDPNQVTRTKVDKQQRDGFLYFEDILRLDSRQEEIPVISVYPHQRPWNGTVVLWIDGAGKQGMFDDQGELRTEVRGLIDSGVSVVGADLFQQGEFLVDDETITEQRVVNNPREVAAYTFCYNDTLLVRRVHDVLTLIAFIGNDEHETKKLVAIGTEGAGPVVALARALVGAKIDTAVVDINGFRFANITSYRDINFVPGAVKYGDVPNLIALSAPHRLVIMNEGGRIPSVVKQAYAQDDAAIRSIEEPSLEDALQWAIK